VAKRWKCARCGTENEEPSLTCSNCRMIRGAVVVPTTKPPSEGWPATGSPASSGASAPMSGAADGSDVSGTIPITAPGAESSTYWVPETQVPAAPRPLWRRLVRWVIPAAFILAAIGGAIFSASRSSTGEISRSGDMHWSELRIGDCFDFKDPTEDKVSDVTARPCTDEHEYEVILIPTMPAGTYPTVDAFASFVEGECVPAFGSYVGMDYEQSELDIYWLYPDEDGWSHADRTLLCAGYHPRIHRLTGSLKGSNR
jgi:hypothetical protein